jgi:uncharacterized protein
MRLHAFRDIHPFSRLIFSLFIILVCFLLFLALSVIAAIPIFGLDAVMNMASFTDLSNPDTLRLLKFFQVVQSFGLFIIPPFILASMFHHSIAGYLFLDRKVTPLSSLLVIALIFFALPAINFTGELNNQMHFPEWASGVEDWMKNAEERAEELTKAFLKVENIGGLMFNLFMIALLPAIGEELLFRGVIQRIFTEWTRSHHWGIWISAILFSALHIQFYGFIPRMLLGVLFGYLLVWSGSIWLPIIAHFFNNAFAVIAMYLIDRGIVNPELEDIGAGAESYYAAFLSLGMVILLILLIRRDNRDKELDYIGT